ncbi:MAG: methyl-accepting chemotaxis protein [Microcystis aeruginosa K13-05]|uniref:methyl-accepting chemotaxis protein n=1 Tax=unclassified Microcystis TaxID=2643300 RepID=UPI0022C0AF30|nr:MULTISPECIES: methyl-accepting chemotaxis protein [unclassified Microcystis]MCZ8046702.1 methyl-accepting chemotaxis protein [Microcystis sp. LE19-41.2A]MCZ8289990.1 methyl-accepting chemotaxis protein [Microcystis sp. LE19-59.1C]NCR80077.1 methyl-accepting chemotaxis protein [Microcystis aeruginosa K13-10]NCR84712.1 methyl-accepting chemotaxis protein [Microcystis aeruginosa K13-05]
MALLNLFPPYLIVLTLVLVIFPTVLAVGIRIALYKHLQESTVKVKRLIRGESRGVQPKIISNLENRFKIASSQLDDVNTAALVDGLYHEEKFTFMSKSLSCEKWDYFVRVLPNLLLAFGLLGTFLGITLNLTGISTLIDINNVDVQSLGEKLKTPLESMGIAFITSLIGLACSSLLTVINLIFNTNLAKVNLISSLEDYLDNILQPTVEGNSRLDKAVNRMVDKQQAFLTNFHTEVTRVLESSLGKVAKEIADGNQETAKLVTQVCERLTETAGTLSTGATTFQRSAFELNEQVPIITQANREFTKSSQELKNSVLLFKQASELIEKSNFSGNIERFTASLAETQGRFSQSTAILEQNIGEIISSNKRANDLAEQVYLNIQESSQKLQNSALGFLEASEKIESSQFADKLVQATADLMTAHQQFANSTTDLNQSTQSLASLTQDFQLSMTTMVELGIKITDLNQKSETILEQNQQRSVTEQEKLSNIQGELVKLIETVKTYQDSFNSESKQLGNQFINRLDERLSQTSDKILTASHGIERSSNNLDVTNANLSRLIDTVTEQVTQVSEKILEQNQQRSVTEQEKLSNIQGELVKLIETVKTYQDSFNSESKQLGNQLINRLEQRLSQTSDKILTASHGIERSSNNPEVTNANLSQLIGTVTEQLTQVKESLQSDLNLLSNNLGMVVDDKLTKNSEQLKAVSQSIEKTANQFGSLKSDFSQVINAVNTNTSQLTANLESLRDKLEKVIAKENKSNQKMIEHIYGEIHKCLAELEKIGEMSSEFSNLKDKMKELKELFETIPNPPQKDVQDDIDKLNKKLEELKKFFETIPNLTQKNVQSEFSNLKDEMKELFETIPNPPQKDVQDDINTLFE